MKFHKLRPLLPDALAALLLVALPLLVFWQVWASNPADRVMFGGDILMGAYPTRVFVHQLFARGLFLFTILLRGAACAVRNPERPEEGRQSECRSACN